MLREIKYKISACFFEKIGPKAASNFSGFSPVYIHSRVDFRNNFEDSSPLPEQLLKAHKVFIEARRNFI